MKYYIVVVCEHESNTLYFMKGTTLREAVIEEMKDGGAFEWAEESEMDTDEMMRWIEDGDGGECVYVVVSDTPITQLQ